MSEVPLFPRLSYLLLCILGMTLVTSGFPRPRPPLRNPHDSDGLKRDDWDIGFPSTSLHDWSVHVMAAPGVRAPADSRARLRSEAWLFAPETAEVSVEGPWSSQGAGAMKRNIGVADDAAFREKSKLLTSMERQKWLNTYMQKLLVVNASR
ncbi:tuberoinfundibular peptide of 39 residues [Salarias fasciatus]|uniref:Tuberoinfundibular peptide of 39 residues n=1 Tax=Salarias fasciatus TaxID=181472 RepID=A0A672I4J6_SALFA|nr:tuberoinfundibular peptide of 39 residues [Salarias fasciatus]